MNMKSANMGIMTESVIAKFGNGHSRVKSIIFTAMALWLGLVCFLGAKGAFIGSPDSPPLPIFLGLAIPLAVFFAAYFGWRTFRDFILGADLRFVTAMQAWRWAGMYFLFLYSSNVLPGLFAFPAGFGDMAVGITAPWMVLSLVRQPSFAASRRYMIWNILGIVDFVVAVSMAVLSSGLFHGITRFNGNITTGTMSQLPLVLTPAYIVPFFTMLHLTALFQARHLARSE